MRDLALKLPSRLGVARLWRRFHTSSMPVLMFHGVLPDADGSPFNSTGKFISPERLRDFLARIMRTFRVVPMDQIARPMSEGQQPKNVMAVTFDDGYANVYEYAWPLLRDLGIPFTVYVTTGPVDTDRILWTDLLEFAVITTAVGALPAGYVPAQIPLQSRQERLQAIAQLKRVLKEQPLAETRASVNRLAEALGVDMASPELAKVRFLTSSRIREMAEAGVTFGGHTVTHPILSQETRERVSEEVTGCKHALEAITGRTVEHFAYPNGRVQDFNQMVKDELRAAGYVSSVTTINGLHRPGDDLFEIKRIGVDNRWDYAEFETRASGILKAFQREI